MKTVCADASPKALARIRNEEAALRRLEDVAFVPRLLEAGATGPLRFVASEWRSGVTVHELMRHLAASTAVESAAGAECLERLVLRLGSAFRRLHGHGIVHGDITSRNVLISDTGITILDFESAAPTDPDEAWAPDPASVHRYTVGYAAPERLTDIQAALLPAPTSTRSPRCSTTWSRDVTMSLPPGVARTWYAVRTGRCRPSPAGPSAGGRSSAHVSPARSAPTPQAATPRWRPSTTPSPPPSFFPRPSARRNPTLHGPPPIRPEEPQR